MGATTTSPSLLARVRDPDDLAAWHEFDARYGELILRYCRTRHIQHADAEDIRQLVMGRLARALRRFRYASERGRFRSYLGRITRNEISRYFRRPTIAARRVSGDVQAVCREHDAVWEREWVHHHLRLAMRTLRQSFEPRSVEIFEQLLEGVPPVQLAERFGMSRDAVHKVKQRIRDRLEELVARQIRDEDDPDGDRTSRER